MDAGEVVQGEKKRCLEGHGQEAIARALGEAGGEGGEAGHCCVWTREQGTHPRVFLRGRAKNPPCVVTGSRAQCLVDDIDAQWRENALSCVCAWVDAVMPASLVGGRRLGVVGRVARGCESSTVCAATRPGLWGVYGLPAVHETNAAVCVPFL